MLEIGVETGACNWEVELMLLGWRLLTWKGVRRRGKISRNVINEVLVKVFILDGFDLQSRASRFL